MTPHGLYGLDARQVRRWRSWYRWVTLAKLACAFLVVAAVTEHAPGIRHRGAHPVDLQRDPAPVRGPGLSARRRSWAPVALVVVATPAPGTRPGLPLPPASQRTVKITNSGWSINLAITGQPDGDPRSRSAGAVA